MFHMDNNTCNSANSYCNPQKTTIHPFSLNVMECPYLLQFSETTGLCKNFTEVKGDVQDGRKSPLTVVKAKRKHTLFCMY